ncbi:2-phosphosulfolactate phosphatase [Streptomyces sp. CC208A]|uniref:2-phosphosulfolactate phosphatase n=1 Tax=Streptomyces sp. CC208A TaxID=3044573 RepID=UPI0024A8DABA|nr:2-phosphosulfolactate phosphatase [Streptomyces sp. CC208A]
MSVAFGWGPVEARALVPDPTACLVVVDVLSFTTAAGVSEERPLAVIASGERWPDGSLRPVLEDHLGAGAVLDALRTLAPGHHLTPEATAAATPWAATDDPVAALHGCDSGRELYEYGYPQDVEVAAETDASTAVPVLVDGAFTEAP